VSHWQSGPTSGRGSDFQFSLLVESQQGKTGKRQSLIISSTDPLLKLSAAIINLDWSQQLSIENKHSRMA
jgi:hypothetical protein